MKRLFGSVCAITMLMGLPALAASDYLSNEKFAQRGPDEQQGQQRGGRAEGGGRVQSTPNRGPQGDNRGPGQGGGDRGPQASPRGSAQVAPNSGPQGDNRGRGQITGGQVPRGGGPSSAPSSPNRGPQAGPGQFAQGRGNVAGPVEHGPREFERRAFQRNLTAPRRFRVGAFRPPPGWQYRQWAYGEYLPPMFWAQMYWITDFWRYDLDRPPLGCEWVRTGPDALLVDTSTGEILEVVYNVFY